METGPINSTGARQESPVLAVVVPVFNEQQAAEGVLREWIFQVERIVGSFVFLVLDDGSTDRTPQILEDLAVKSQGRIKTFRHSNRGHGQTCLKGYQAAIDVGAEWILQIDSDGQCDPAFFPTLWSKRAEFDVIYGVRNIREDGLKRIMAGKILRYSLKCLYRVSCPDPNVPYRLMRTEAVASLLPKIPASFVLANVALAALVDRNPDLRVGSVPITFRQRAGGEPSVPFRAFACRAIELFRQMTLLTRETDGLKSRGNGASRPFQT